MEENSVFYKIDIIFKILTFTILLLSRVAPLLGYKICSKSQKLFLFFKIIFKKHRLSRKLIYI